MNNIAIIKALRAHEVVTDHTTMKGIEDLLKVGVSLTCGINTNGIFWVRAQTPKLVGATRTGGSLPEATNKALEYLASLMESEYLDTRF